jgi:hypothetical protein
MTASERLIEAGYEDVIILSDYSYDDALIGVTDENRAVYDYEKMIDWLCEKENMSEEDAIEWVNYNTIRSLPYAGGKGPIVMYKVV